MKFENTEVMNFENAIRGMRNPKESWDKSDSFINCGALATDEYPYATYVIGKNDLELMQTLIRAGTEHRKFMRQIFVSVDITAPIYWWKEFDTYKVGTVANSMSTMHKLASTPITWDCFEMDDYSEGIYDNVYHSMDMKFTHGGSFYCDNLDCVWEDFIEILEQLRQKYNETKDKRYWKELIRLLPESWLQKRTVTMNYENLLAMCSKGQRRFHKLTEWSKSFIDWARSLPYAQELIFIDELEKEEN